MRHAWLFIDYFIIIKYYYYMAKASGRCNALSDWLRARSEQGILHP